MLCQQHPDRTIFHFSAGGRQKTLRELQQNLTRLVEAQGYELCSALTIPFETVDFIANPHLLVGRQVRHLFIESDGAERWYTGTVLSMDKHRLFHISYDEEDHEDIFCFNLLEDLVVGDLVVL